MASLIDFDNSPARQLAQELRLAGISTIPIRADGTKKPALDTWKEFQVHIPTEAEIDDMFRGRCGVAIVGGKVSGNLETLDIDEPVLVQPFETLVEEMSPGLLARLTTAATPRDNHGGRHYRYRIAAEVAKSTVLARSEIRPQFNEDGTPNIDPKTGKQRMAPDTMIETRGEGGYSLAPGCPGCCHRSGLPYKHLSGPPLSQVPTITSEEQGVLWQVAKWFNRFVEEHSESKAGPRKGKYDGLSPGDDFNGRASWDDILLPAGWTKCRTLGSMTAWRRPGKERGVSATTGCKSSVGTELFCVFSTNAHPLQGPSDGRPCTSYNKFAAFATLQHAGDFSAAARTLAAQGYGERSKAHIPAGTAAIAAARIRLPEPFVPFPVQALPRPIRTFVVESAQAIGCDQTLVALPMLATLAGCIGATRRLQLKSGWYAPAVLWTAAVVDSGQQKSPAQGAVTMPLYRRQGRDLGEHQERMLEYHKQLAIYENDLQAWKRSKEPGKGEPPDKPQEPACKRIIISDSTIEAVADRLHENARGLLLDRDELSGWLGSYDQYRAGRGGDVSHWLSCYNAKPLLIDRKTSTRKTIFIERSAVSITGGIQPRILSRMLGEQHFENGLAARFGFGMPPKRAKVWNNASVSASAAQELEFIYEALLALDFQSGWDGKPVPVDLPLTSDGTAAFIEFYNQHGEEQAMLSGNLAALWAKLEEAAARIALVIHLVRCAAEDSTLGSKDEVDSESVGAGVVLARWLGNEGRRIYEVLAESDGDRERRQLIELIERKGGELTIRDLCRSSRQFQRAELAEGALAELVKAGAGRWEVVSPPTSGGHATRRFVMFDRRSVDTREVFLGENPSSVSVGREQEVKNEAGEEVGEWTA